VRTLLPGGLFYSADAFLVRIPCGRFYWGTLLLCEHFYRTRLPFGRFYRVDAFIVQTLLSYAFTVRTLLQCGHCYRADAFIVRTLLLCGRFYSADAFIVRTLL